MEATQHLVDMGCRKIAHIRGPKTLKMQSIVL
jgi:DNA-binding LacI/PurR family transcriptional regulator